MHATLLTLLAAMPPPTGFTRSVERIALVRGGGEARIEVDALAAQIIVTGAKVVQPKRTSLCPKLDVRRADTVLSCKSRRIWASVEEDKLGLYLDVRELKGVVPGGRDELKPVAWPLKALNIPDSCPGTTPAGQGECLWRDEKYDAAVEAFTRALGGPDNQLALLRLGDAALMREDWEGALQKYAKVTVVGSVGRMAHERECALIGTCLDDAASAEAGTLTGLPEALKREMQLRNLRRDTVAGRAGPAMIALAEAITEDSRLCDDALALCQRLVAIALEDADEEVRLAGLKAYLLPVLRSGPHEGDLAVAASKAAESIGAPAFAGALASMATPHVAKDQLEEHLVRTARLFLKAQDKVRAAVIVEYAEGRCAGARGAKWAPIRKALGDPRAPPTPPVAIAKAEPPPAPLAKLDTALEAEALTELSRVTLLRSRAATPAPSHPLEKP